METQKKIDIDLSNKIVIIASDDFIPYPYIKQFIPYLKNSKIYLLTDPVKYARYTKILLKSFNIKNIKFVSSKDIDNYLDVAIFVLFFGKKYNQDKNKLLTIARLILINDQELIALSEDGVDIDENSSIYRS
jgi:hypothetical protein